MALKQDTLNPKPKPPKLRGKASRCEACGFMFAVQAFKPGVRVVAAV